MWNERRNITTDATYIIKAKKKKSNRGYDEKRMPSNFTTYRKCQIY